MESSNLHDNSTDDLQSNSHFTILQLKFQNNQDDFSKHSILEVRKYLNEISSSWQWISFANNHKSFIFKETESNAIDKFLNLKYIQIFNFRVEISITAINEINKNRRFIHQKNLICLDDDLIMEYLKHQNVISIFRIKRRDESGNNISTGSFIIQFNSTEVPEFINVDFIRIKTQVLENRPMKCNHCQIIGHTVKKCRILNQILCKVCHYPVDENNEINHECNVRCKNCKQIHNSSSKLCPKYIQHKQIIYIKEKFGLSHQEACKRLELNEFGNEKHVHQVKMCTPISNNMDETVKATIDLQKCEIENLQSTIIKLKEDNHNKMRNLIMNHLKEAKKSIIEKENYGSMIEAVQTRNANLDMKINYFENFINSAKIIKNEYTKYKKKMKYEI